LPLPTASRQRLRLQGCLGALLLPALLLSGCGSLPNQNGFSHWGDGAPSKPVDLSKIPDAEPRIAPYSRYGNPDSYIVNGRRYKVLSNSAHFEQQGIASWYGTKFHGHKTSSGERYDMFAMTAAHKTLPLPTWLEVTNRNNGKRVIVKINDRGPFISERILDLSYAAAAKLGITDTGTAPVTIRAINPAAYLARKKQTATQAISTAATHPLKPSPPTQGTNTSLTATPAPLAGVKVQAVDVTSPPPPKMAKKPVPATGIAGFYLQVAAFSERRNAEQLRRKLLVLKPKAIRIDSDTNPGKSPSYRVQIGPLSSLSEAGKLATQVSSLGLGEPKILLD